MDSVFLHSDLSCIIYSAHDREVVGSNRTDHTDLMSKSDFNEKKNLLIVAQPVVIEDISLKHTLFSAQCLEH